MSLVTLAIQLLLVVGFLLFPVWRRSVSNAQLDQRHERLLQKVNKASEKFESSSKVRIELPLLVQQLNPELENNDKEKVEVAYLDVIPKGVEFVWSHKLNKRGDYANAIVRTLFRKDTLRKLHKAITIESRGDGSLIFHRAYWSDARAGVDYTWKTIIKLTEMVLKRSVPVMKDVYRDKQKSVASRLLKLAKKGHRGAIEALILNYPQSKEREKLSELAQSIAFRERNGLSSLLGFLLDKNIDFAEDLVKEADLGKALQKRICHALISTQDQDRIGRVLRYCSTDMKLDLMNRLESELVEGPLHNQLEHFLDSDDDHLQLTAVQTFGRLGTRDSVVVLKERHRKWMLDSELKYSLSVAIETIQERLGQGGGRGGLSVVDNEAQAGELSLSEEQKGRVALAKSQSKLPQ